MRLHDWDAPAPGEVGIAEKKARQEKAREREHPHPPKKARREKQNSPSAFASRASPNRQQWTLARSEKTGRLHDWDAPAPGEVGIAEKDDVRRGHEKDSTPTHRRKREGISKTHQVYSPAAPS